jgi:hypothetical protein
MSWVMAGVAVVGGGIQVYQGMQQKKAGRAMEAGLNKPEFQIPTEIAKNMSEADIRSYQGLPDEQKAAFLDNQQRAAQTALRSSGDRRGGLGMVSQIQAQQDRSSLELLQQDVAARDKNILRAQEARNVMASYKDKRFEHEYNEYSADLDYARAQVGAGMQNVAGGLMTAASGAQAGISGMNTGKSDKALHKLQVENNINSDIINNATNTGGIPQPYQSETVNYAIGNNRQKRKIARNMFRTVEQGGENSTAALGWIQSNLGGQESGQTSPTGEYQNLNFGQLASKYGGTRFGRRYVKRNDWISGN